MSIEQGLGRFRDQGFLVADDMVEPAVLDELEAGARRIRDKIRAGEVDIKTVFGDNDEPSVIWGLLAPEYGEPVFADHLVSEPIASYVRALLGDELRLGGLALFATANQVPYDTGWHRDLGGADKGASEAEELALLNRPKTVFKWHVALVDDPCLWIVPGSQRRYRTEAERVALVEDIHAPLAGAEAIKLKRGQTVFWDGATIHRGWAPEGIEERLSLVGSLRQYREDEPPEKEVDERFAWLLAYNIREALPEKMQLYYDRWRALQPV